jgi:CRISPR/Cas system-associated exonuclease Cas4 (RecB family)
LSYSKNNKLLLSEKQFNEALYELIEYTANGLHYLYKLKAENNKIEISFEYPLPQNKYNIIGSIDCLIIDSGNVTIIDFKRSEAAIGSKQGLLEYEKLQLWLYGLAVSENFNVHKIGYLNISELDSSLEVDFAPGAEAFVKKFLDLQTAFKNETQFLPKPREENVCEFCSLKLICTKGCDL